MYDLHSRFFIVVCVQPSMIDLRTYGWPLYYLRRLYRTSSNHCTTFGDLRRPLYDHRWVHLDHVFMLEIDWGPPFVSKTDWVTLLLPRLGLSRFFCTFQSFFRSLGLVSGCYTISLRYFSSLLLPFPCFHGGGFKNCSHYCKGWVESCCDFDNPPLDICPIKLDGSNYFALVS